MEASIEAPGLPRRLGLRARPTQPIAGGNTTMLAMVVASSLGNDVDVNSQLPDVDVDVDVNVGG